MINDYKLLISTLLGILALVVVLQLKNPDHRTWNFEKCFTGSKVMGNSNLDLIVQSKYSYLKTSFGGLFLIGRESLN